MKLASNDIQLELIADYINKQFNPAGNESDKAVLNTSTSTRTPEEVLASGAALYTANCSSCHGGVESNQHRIQLGSTALSITEAFNNFAVMNHLKGALSEPQLNDLATYIVSKSPERIPPSTPLGVSAFNTEAGSISIQWNASTDNVGVSGYKVYRNDIEVQNNDSLSFVDSNLTPETLYTYSVIAYDEVGNESAASEKLQVKTLPDTDAPEVPVISQLTNAGIGSVTIRWSAVSDNIGTTNYKVYRGGEQVYSGSATEFTDNGLAPNTLYTYQVSAQDAAANSSAKSVAKSIVSSEDDLPPSQITNLQASEQNLTSIKITWNAGTDNIAVSIYQIFRNDQLIGESSGTTFTDGTLSPDTNYKYNVYALDAAGNRSPVSDSLNAKTLPDTDAPAQPGSLTAGDITPYSLKLSWEASADNIGVAHYKLYQGNEMIYQGGELSFEVSELEGQAYSFSVSAVDAAGNESDKAVLNTSTSTRTPEEVLASGAALYTANCSSCHGGVESNQHRIQLGSTALSITEAFNNFAVMNHLKGALSEPQLNDLATYIVSKSPERIPPSTPLGLMLLIPKLAVFLFNGTLPQTMLV